MSKAQEIIDEFSFIEGGLFRKVQLKLGVANHQGFLALAGICFAWLPLAILTSMDGTLYSGPSIPFILDFGIHARLLVAVPMLILIRGTISLKTAAVTKYLSGSLLKEEGKQKMISSVLPFARKLACSSVTELILLLFVGGSVFSLYSAGTYGGIQGEASTWMFLGLPEENILSRAGKWAVYVSLPFFQFLLLQWLWRYIVWMYLLFRFSKANLDLLPTHADRCGGLGIVILAQRSFSFVFVAGSLVISGQLITHFIDQPDLIKVILAVVIGYIVLCMILLFLPLFFFIAQLVKTRQAGMLRLSLLATEMSRTFESEWLNETPLEKRIETRQVDPSMAYDYASMYDNLQQLRVIPVTKNDIIGIALTLVLPFVPIVFIYYSAKEVLEKIIGLLF